MGCSSFVWPNCKRFALCLTHDVDRVKKEWWHCLYYFVKTRRIYHLRSLFPQKEDPYWNFERIMDIEEKYGVRSTFFFLNECKKVEVFKPITYPLAFGNYDISDPGIVGIIKKLYESGWEVGVHGSYDSYASKKLLIKEKEEFERVLGHPVYGIRQHYLNLKVPNTWKIQRDVGFKYDASLGYRDKVGFREGRELPFKPFNDDFLIIPLAIMDGPLFTSSRSVDDAWHKCKELINYCEKKGALLTILWHNNRFDEKEYPGQAEVYENIIEECQKRNAFIGRAIDIRNIVCGSR